MLILRDITHKRLRDQKIKAVSLLNAHPSGIIVMADAQDPQNVQIVLLADVPNQQQPEIGEQQHVAAETNGKMVRLARLAHSYCRS